MTSPVKPTDRLREVESEVKELRIVANNNRSNYAPRLAARIQKLLREKQRIAEKLQTKRAGELF